MTINPIRLFQKTVKFSDINFSKGIVKRFGMKFNGTIEDILRNGDSITLTVENGKITQSIRKGQENFLKKFFSPKDKLHDLVYTYDENGKLISRLRKTKKGFEFLNGEHKVTKEFIQNSDNTSIVRRFALSRDEKTTTVYYKNNKPVRITAIEPKYYAEERTIVDFENAFLNIKTFNKTTTMQNRVLEFDDREYDFNKMLLSIEHQQPQRIMNHSKEGYDSTTGINNLKKQLKKVVPCGLGERFYKIVIEPLLKSDLYSN